MYAKDAFIALKRTLTNTVYSKLFNHDFLPTDTQK